MAQMPIFGAGNYENILSAISKNQISYPAWMYCRDKHMLGFVEKDGSFVLMKGDNKEQVVHVDALPDVSKADKEVLYIFNGIVYDFDGEKFNPLGKDHTTELQALDKRVTDLEGKVVALEEIAHQVIDISELESKVKELEAFDIEVSEKVTGLEAEANTMKQQISDVDDKVDALEEKVLSFYEEVKYEVVSKPEGTIVDYREDEIRIMCPEGTVFTKQSVGSTGNANMHYMGFKAYAPEGAVGFKEGDQGVIKDEYFDFSGDFAGTDEFGRNYSIVWLALASYNESTGEWTYFGKTSTVEKYIGWTYCVEWYDVNGIIIESDSVRINLSNEACHYKAEPYYVKDYTSEFDALKAKNEALSTQIKALEDAVNELEENSLTFVELD